MYQDETRKGIGSHLTDETREILGILTQGYQPARREEVTELLMWLEEIKES